VPSHRESFGRAALEAMASGKPVVVSDAGNLPHLVEDAGLVVRAGDPEGLASAIVRIIEDDALAAGLAARGRRNAARYDNALVSRQLLEAIRAVEEA